jgi:hypothetical protein
MASWEEFSRIVAEAKASKKLDPVGHEDDDVDNDGDSDSSDSYLKKRRATVGAAIAADKKKKVEEGYNDLDEAKVDEKLPEHERATARDKRSGHNLPGSGTRRVRRAEHEERRGKPKRWWDDDGDGIGWEKGEVKKESVEQIDEIAPLVAGGIAAAAAAPYLAKKFLSKPINKALDNATKTNKLPLATGGNMQQLRQAQNNSYQPEGEMVEEDKEYRREMAKAAARERAEEKKEKGKKAAKIPGRLGISSGTSYADKQELSIKGHDKVTKKAKHTVGNPFPEEYAVDGEYIEEMPYQVYGSHDGTKEKKIGKPVKSRKYAHDRADELSDTHKETGGKFRVQKEENDLDEGMTMKDFKQQRSRQKQKDKRETEKTSPLRRAGIHDDKASPERAARHRANVDPDYDHDDEENMYPGGKLKDPKKIRKAKAVGELAKEEYIEEKALSRAQQRFMGMVYAAKKGGTPASPEVAKAAEGMSKKAARDFAKTKHEGLPEKKEVKEELSLIDKMILEFSPLSEGKLDDLLADIRGEDDGEKKSSKKSEEERKEAAKKQVKRGKSDPSALTRRAAVAGAARLKAEKEKTKRQRERQQYEKERRTEKDEAKAKSREESDAAKAKAREESDAEKRMKAKKKELEAKEKERKDAEEAKKEQKKEHRAKLKQDVKNAWSGNLKVASSEKDTDVADALVSNVAKVGGGVIKTAGALGKYGVRRLRAKTQERKENQKEEFSNWREEFIFEVDDQSVQNEKQKVIDVSKKKNKIEINPNMSEGCGCEEKEEKKETPQKDMRDLPTKVNLLKTKARAMGARNPIVMIASEGAAWTKKEGKSEAGGLNEKGRKSYERENPGSDLKAPSKEVGNPRRASFCARMRGMKEKLTSQETARDPDSRINKSLRAWNC